MSEPRKMTTDRHKSSLIVENSVSTSGEKVAEKLAERAQGLPGDFTAVDFLAVLLFLQALQAEARGKLIVADKAHRDERADDDDFRQERDEASADLSQVIQRLRDAFRAAYGSIAIKKFGFDLRMAREPVAVLAQGIRLLTNLNPPDLVLPPSTTPGVSVDLASLLPPLEAAVARLQKALDDVAREKTEADATQVAKNLAMDEFDDTFLRVARTLEALYTLAGELDLAERVRPSRRRPGRTETVDEQPEPQEPQEPGPEPDPPPIGFTPPPIVIP